MRKFISGLDKTLYYFAGCCFLILFIVNVVNIALRTFTSYSLLWAVDFSQFLLVWIVALAAVVALYRNEHLVITYVKEKFSRKIELGIDIITRLILIAFYLILIVSGIEIAQIRMNINYISLGWPTGYASGRSLFPVSLWSSLL